MLETIININGNNAVDSYLRGFVDRLTHMSPLMDDIASMVLAQTDDRFASGGPDPAGSPWKQSVSPNSARVRTLEVSGALRRSFRSVRHGNNSVSIGTDIEYAAIHQFGGRTAAHIIRPRNKKALKTPYGIFKKVNHPGSVIPARPFLGLSADNSTDIIGIINNYIAQR